MERNYRAPRAPAGRAHALRSATALAVALLGTAATFAPTASAQRAPVGFLTQQPVSGDALQIAREFLRSDAAARGLAAGDVEALTVTDRYRSSHNGVTHLYLRQTWQGIEVVNANLTVNVTADGRVINAEGSLVSQLAANVNTRTAALAPSDAVRRAADHLGLRGSATLEARGPEAAAVTRDVVFHGPAISREDIHVALRYYAVDAGAGARQARLAWQLDIQTPDQRHWYVLWVDAVTGEVLGKVDHVANDTYEVFPLPLVSPDEGPRTIEVDPADSLASPFGWHDTDGVAGAEYTDTRGNNVFAQEDRDANNFGGDRPDGGPGLDFQLPLDLNQGPETYIPFATANLFYWNNVVHDILYYYGFDEAAGNFQQNNYGRGGVAGDPVQADAQDGSGTNNANFGTPPDGSDPRMQMFVWTGSSANELEMLAGDAAGSYFATGAGFGPNLGEIGVSADLVVATDGTGADVSDGCEALTNGAELAGNIAVINRGNCTFVIKVRNAQSVGASAAIIVNNVAGSPITLGDDGTGGDITIPSGMISLADGDTIKPTLPEAGAFRGGPEVVDRDSDLDAGVIVHEYGHGLSNRLTGGPSNVGCLNNTEQMGEGWSDWYAVAMTGKVGDTAEQPRGVGTYVIYQPVDGTGIRSFPYSRDMAVNPFTYSDIASQSIPHGVGSVWATMLWDMYWNLVDEYGFDPDLYNGTGGNNIAIQLVTDGMKLQPCSPGFVDGRDAILLADQVNYGGANECLIWDAFARRGLGVGASQGSNQSVSDGAESFDVPAQCQGGGDGIVVGAPTPGVAGVENCYPLSGVTPGNSVVLLIGLQAGDFQLPFCDDPLGLARPFPRGGARADADGNATLCTVIPQALAGRSVLAQGLDPQADGCDLSNVDTTQF